MAAAPAIVSPVTGMATAWQVVPGAKVTCCMAGPTFPVAEPEHREVGA